MATNNTRSDLTIEIPFEENNLKEARNEEEPSEGKVA